jgi:hypothetical protein
MLPSSSYCACRRIPPTNRRLRSYPCLSCSSWPTPAHPLTLRHHRGQGGARSIVNAEVVVVVAVKITRTSLSQRGLAGPVRNIMPGLERSLLPTQHRSVLPLDRFASPRGGWYQHRRPAVATPVLRQEMQHATPATNAAGMATERQLPTPVPAVTIRAPVYW